MAINPQSSTKHLAINKANAQLVVIVAITSFITVFCLVAAKTVWSQDQYQARVTTADNTAHQQLLTNISAFGSLVNSFQTFNSASTNIIGGSSSGSGPNSGNNAKIVLDALPPAYDFPALITSINKILSNGGYDLTGISGTDEQLAEGANNSSNNPQPVSMPFTITIANASYSSVQQLLTTLQSSIRPIQISSISLNGGSSDITLTINAQTYYQPAKTVSINKQVVQ